MRSGSRETGLQQRQKPLGREISVNPTGAGPSLSAKRKGSPGQRMGQQVRDPEKEITKPNRTRKECHTICKKRVFRREHENRVRTPNCPFGLLYTMLKATWVRNEAHLDVAQQKTEETLWTVPWRINSQRQQMKKPSLMLSLQTFMF